MKRENVVKFKAKSEQMIFVPLARPQNGAIGRLLLVYAKKMKTKCASKLERKFIAFCQIFTVTSSRKLSA